MTEWDEMMAWMADQAGPHAALARDHLLRIELMRDGIKARDSDVHELRQEERERCIATLRALKDDGGVNDDGQTWLRRLTRGDCVAALLALGPNV